MDRRKARQKKRDVRAGETRGIAIELFCRRGVTNVREGFAKGTTLGVFMLRREVGSGLKVEGGACEVCRLTAPFR